MKYCLTQYGLGWKNSGGIILICMKKDEFNQLIKEIYSWDCISHFASCTTAHNIVRDRYYLPTLFNDTHRYVRSCRPCQFFTRMQRFPALPLNRIIVEDPFQQWGLYFIGEFKEKSYNGCCWVLNATNYFTSWIEAIPTKKEIEEVVMGFLEDRLIIRLVPLPKSLLTMPRIFLP
jgi:hypothetical protein